MNLLHLETEPLICTYCCKPVSMKTRNPSYCRDPGRFISEGRCASIIFNRQRTGLSVFN